jgi:uncharacterized HhH-GPD family protein
MTRIRRLPIEPVTDERTAFAFVLGVLFNQRMRADDAWKAPYALGLRLGGLTPAHVLALPEGDFADLFAEPTAIHPFKRVMAARVYQTAGFIEATYDGDARQLWAGATAGQFLERFQALPGVGRHKATVALFVITRELGVDIRADDRRYSITGCASLAQRFHPYDEPLLV